jgi:predicted HTH domain antitoxin
MAIILSDEFLTKSALNETELRLEMAIWLYQKGKISLGKAAELAEINKIELQNVLGERQIPMNYSLTDYLQDTLVIQKIPPL